MDLVVFAMCKKLGVQTTRRRILALHQLLPPRKQKGVHNELEPRRECLRIELVHQTLELVDRDPPNVPHLILVHVHIHGGGNEEDVIDCMLVLFPRTFMFPPESVARGQVMNTRQELKRIGWHL